MRRIFALANRIHEKTKWKVSSIFLVLNIIFWCMVALLLSLLGYYAGTGTIEGHEVSVFCIVGYTGLLIGFLGGAWYLDRQGY